MATKIYIKHGSGTPTGEDIAGPGELAIDIQNKIIYTKDLSDNVIMLGADISSEVIDWSQLDNIPTEFNPADHEHDYTEINDGAGKDLATELADILQHLTNIDTELGTLQGQLTFGGTVDMSTNTITSTTTAADNAGFSAGTIPSPPPVGSENIYFITEKAGEFETHTYNSGDWLISEGNAGGWSGVHFDTTVSVMWDEVGGKPTEFKPEAHVHGISDVTGLQDSLDAKADLSHTHVIADIDQLQDALDAKASASTIMGGTY
jgi:hypothetical protein